MKLRAPNPPLNIGDAELFMFSNLADLERIKQTEPELFEQIILQSIEEQAKGQEPPKLREPKK